jgi:hypothetical protein
MRIPTSQIQAVSAVDVLLAVGIAGIQIASFVALRRTSAPPERDPFDSSLYPYMWFIYPALTTNASLLRPGPWRPEIWAAALTVPFVTEILLVGTVLAPPDTGASLWMAGELLVVLHSGLAYIAGTSALRIRYIHFNR